MRVHVSGRGTGKTIASMLEVAIARSYKQTAWLLTSQPGDKEWLMRQYTTYRRGSPEEVPPFNQSWILTPRLLTSNRGRGVVSPNDIVIAQDLNSLIVDHFGTRVDAAFGTDIDVLPFDGCGPGSDLLRPEPTAGRAVRAET